MVGLVKDRVLLTEASVSLREAQTVLRLQAMAEDKSNASVTAREAICKVPDVSIWLCSILAALRSSAVGLEIWRKSKESGGAGRT